MDDLHANLEFNGQHSELSEEFINKACNRFVKITDTKTYPCQFSNLRELTLVDIVGNEEFAFNFDQTPKLEKFSLSGKEFTTAALEQVLVGQKLKQLDSFSLDLKNPNIKIEKKSEEELKILEYKSDLEPGLLKIIESAARCFSEVKLELVDNSRLPFAQIINELKPKTLTIKGLGRFEV